MELVGIHRFRTGTSPRGEITELRSIGSCRRLRADHEHHGPGTGIVRWMIQSYDPRSDLVSPKITQGLDFNVEFAMILNE